jgi:hypothetical protein
VLLCSGFSNEIEIKIKTVQIKNVKYDNKTNSHLCFRNMGGQREGNKNAYYLRKEDFKVDLRSKKGRK